MLDAFSTEAIAGVAAAIGAFMLRLLVLLWRFSRSPEGRVIIRVLRDSGVRAALKARAAFAQSLARARAADSEGGAAVTPHERSLLARDTVHAFTHELDVLGVLEQAAKAFGGVERLEAELLKRIEAKLDSAATTRAN